MAELSRYNISGEEIETASGILKNKLGITDKKFLEDLETTLLRDTYSHFLNLLEKREIKFDLSLLFAIHTYFLGTLYSWAGKKRTVDISKDGVLFVPASYISNALEELKNILNTNIISPKNSKRQIADKLAIIHCEFNAIHPFREGNGRTIRLFIDLIALYSGYSFIDYKKSSQISYIKSCIAGMEKNYELMAKVMYRGLIENKISKTELQYNARNARKEYRAGKSIKAKSLADLV